MSNYSDTIYALSTPVGKSAIAIIRISGSESLRIIKKIISLKKITANKKILTYLNYNNKPIDHILLTYFKKPRSYTGEDLVEINCHGSTAIITKISQVLEMLGARMAKPGEFSRRALMNDKIDMLQAEGLSDLINAETEKQRSMALSALSGQSTNFVDYIKKELNIMLANIEALIDFSDEDLPTNVLPKLLEQNRNLIKKIHKEITNYKISKSIRSGFVVSIIGKPNTGKSSFINYISNKNISIVTSLPGTTTDSVSSVLDIAGYKITFVDTAGIRKHKNKIEELGVKKTLKMISDSDLCLVFLEKNEINNYKNIKNKIYVRSKLDKKKKKPTEKNIINISSFNGDGIKKLIQKTKEKLVKNKKNEPLFSRERHINIMKNVYSELKSISKKDGLDIKAFKIREALRISLEINEKFDIEDILDVVFNDFCIGK